MKRSSPSYLRDYWLWTLSIIGLSLLVWSFWIRVHFAYDGIQWSNRSSLVTSVDPTGPAAGLLEEGDRILAIDGMPVSQISSLYLGKQPGDTVLISIERGGIEQNLDLYLNKPPWDIMITTLFPLIVAFIFWVAGVYVLAFQQDNLRAQFLILIYLLASALLASGSISLIGPGTAKLLFYVLSWWVSPLLFHFHLHFPTANSTRSLRALVAAFYLIAVLGAALDLIFDSAFLGAGIAYQYFFSFRRIWLAAGFLGVVFLLARSYRREDSRETRSQIGVVALGGALAFTPFLSFTLLPEALFGKEILSYDVSFIFLLVMPLSYGYAILRHRLIPLENFVNRSVTALILIATLSGLYLVLNAILVRLIPSPLWKHTVVNMVLVLVLAGIFGRLHKRLQAFVNDLLYGGWYDYQSAVNQISQTLEPVSDPYSLSQSLVREVQAAMQLECACILLADRKGDDLNRALVCRSCQTGLQESHPSPSNPDVLRYFHNHPSPVSSHDLLRGLADDGLAKFASESLPCQKARLWIPLKNSREINAVLVLGTRRGGGRFTSSDLDILEVISRQAGIALDNISLAQKLNEREIERVRLHQQALRAGEKERKRLARELHDQIIQALVGFNFQLSELRRLSPEMQTQFDRSQSEIRTIIGRLRRICAGLRPPAMDSFGLAAVVRGQVRAVNEMNAFRTILKVEGDEPADLSEEVILCAYRVLQEALQNAAKHSGAQQVRVNLSFYRDRLSLTVEDDGKGFVVPERLGQFTLDDHFGVLGMYERVELINGTLNIRSHPGQGCRLNVGIPLRDKNDL